MPAPLAPFVAFALGVLFAWLAFANADADETSLAQASSWDRNVLAVTLFALLVYAPAAAYFVVYASDWSSAYYLDSRSVPSAIGLLLVLFDIVALPAGFVAARRALAKHSLATLVWLGAIPLVVALGTLAALHSRFGIEASYDQVQSDFGIHPIAGSPLGYAILWLNGIVTAGAIFTAQTLTKNAAASASAPASASASATATASASASAPASASASASGSASASVSASASASASGSAPPYEPEKRLLGRGRRSR